jgi:hypothetical protein
MAGRHARHDRAPIEVDDTVVLLDDVRVATDGHDTVTVDHNRPFGNRWSLTVEQVDIG